MIPKHVDPTKLITIALPAIIALVFSFHTNAQSGALDPTFGINGKVLTPFTAYGSVGNAIALQSDGKIILGGYSLSYYAISDFSLARYNTDGSLDNTFGSNGMVVTTIELRSKGTAIGIQTDGKIVLAGNSSHSINLARYESDGSLDTTFGTGGKVVSSVPGFYGNRCTSMLIQDDGKIVVGGNNSHFSNDILHYFLARFDTNGSLDSTFGVGGIVYGGNEKVNSIDIQNDGKILAAGSDYSNFTLFRYETSGILDSTFGTNGKVTTPIVNVYNEGRKVKVTSDGKILLGGFAYRSNNNSDFALARYTSNGVIDNSFGTGGKVITYIPGSLSSRAHDLEIQSDGKIVLAGYTRNANINFAAARYTDSGLLDSSFGQGGHVVTEFSISYNQANELKIQTDGKLLLGGYATPDSIGDFALVRYHENAVGTNELLSGLSSEKGTILISPNPLNNSSKIQSIVPLKNAELTVVDSQGNIVKFVPNISGSNIPFYPNELQNGLYFLNLSQDGEQMGRFKFVLDKN